MKVSVIIPNYNVKELLKQCIDSLLSINGLTGWRVEVVVVDNGSTDGSVEFIKLLIINGLTSLGKYAQLVNSLTRNKLIIKLIENRKNLGFAKAVNRALRQAFGPSSGRGAQGEYIFLLNNDVVLEKDYLKKLIDFLEKNRDFWMVQGIILTEDGKKIDNAGGGILWRGKVRLFGKPQEIKVMDKEPLILSATATLYRRSLFEKIGFFDEDFFAYLEDVDLSLRAWRRGLKGTILPEATCFHLGRATSKRMGNFKARMDAKNWIFVIVKNWPVEKVLRYFSQIFIERLRNLSGLIKQTVWWQVPWAILITYGECLFKIPKMLLKRVKGW